MSSVYVLGAGFSRAISEKMPVLADLTRQLQRRVPGSFADLDTSRLGGDIESVLTFLATPQPWLARGQQLMNQARFHELTSAIARLLRERQDEALQSPLPLWLSDLVNHWTAEHAVVITLNYDTLVEKAVCEGRPKDSDSGSAGFSSLYPVPVTPLHRRGLELYFGSTALDLFTLLRPHGCIQWLYSGQESFYGEAVYLLPTATPGWRPDDPGPYRDRGLDKVPLIVPPALVKTGFFNSEFIEAQWQQAAQALASADTVTFLGYSLPTTDTTFRHLLATGVRESARAVVVNPDEAVGARFQDLFRGRIDTSLAGCPDPIPLFVRQLTRGAR
jgi:hypothetical protein